MSGVSLWDLWSECSKDTEALGDPLFLECLEAASASRIFDNLSDDKLKASLSLINSLLNDPKTRAKGLTLLNDFSSQINPSRLVTYQDAITSALHLVVKGLDSPLASSVLTNIIPKCHSMTEVNQIVTSSIIPKILVNFCEDGGSGKDATVQKSLEELQLLKVCLTEYHGPCGQFRDKLERILVQLIDNENSEIVEFLGGVMPLLSYSGGGGNAGEKHMKDWNVMLTKFLKTTYATLYQLYGDHSAALEPENPFDGETFSGLKKITEMQVLLRMSLLKRRLLNLLAVTSGYLRFPFPAPKLVPQKGILKLIEMLTSLNPVASNKSQAKSSRKETVFLSAVVPGIHIASLTFLRSLLYCVGSNILVDGISIEQLLAGEFKWLQERPNAYGKLRLELYETLTTWLTMTGGVVTNLKTLSMYVNSIGSDTQVEKDVVELKMLSKKPKAGKSVTLKNPSVSLSINAASITSTTSQTYVQKDPDVCQIALKSLSYLIPALDADNHRKIYEHLMKTASVFTQFHVPPSLYESAPCRLLVLENLTRLACSPQPQSPVSLSLIVTLLRQGLHDPTRLVSSFCSCQITILERLMHPSGAPLALAGPIPTPVALDNTRSPSNVADQEEMEVLVDDDSINTDEEKVLDADRGTSSMQNEQGGKESFTSLNPINLEALQKMFKQSLESVLRNYSVAGNSSCETRISSALPKRFMRPGRDLSPVARDDLSDGSSDEDSNEIIVLDGDQNSDRQEPKEKLTQTSLINNHAKLNGNSHFGNGNRAASSATDGNGASHQVENELDSDNDLARNKRKSRDCPDSVSESETIIGEIQVKKAKTVSPTKSSATEIDGPSVNEMLESFIDLEPIV